MKVTFLNSSHNVSGNCQFLIDVIKNELEKEEIMYSEFNVHKMILNCKTPFCTTCTNPCDKNCYKDTLLEECFEDMKTSDVIIFASPVYFGSMTGQMKCLFDKTRFYRAQKAFLGKKAGFITCGGSKYGGQEATIKAMHDCVLIQGMDIIGNSSNTLGVGHHGVCAHRPADKDEFAIVRAKSLASRIIELSHEK